MFAIGPRDFFLFAFIILMVFTIVMIVILIMFWPYFLPYFRHIFCFSGAMRQATVRSAFFQLMLLCSDFGFVCLPGIQLVESVATMIAYQIGSSFGIIAGIAEKAKGIYRLELGRLKCLHCSSFV